MEGTTAGRDDVAARDGSSEGLRRNAVSPRMVAVTSMAAAGPAATIALVTPVMAGFAGPAMIFALVVTTIALAALTNTFAEFAKRIPSVALLIYLRLSGRAGVEEVGKAFAVEWEDAVPAEAPSR